MPCRTNQERQTAKCVRQKEHGECHEPSERKIQIPNQMRKMDNQKHNHGREHNHGIAQSNSSA